MDSALNIDVAALDASHRRALEEVIGQELAASQRLVISVVDFTAPTDSTASTPRPAQTLDEWTSIYDGLSDEEIEAIDKIAKTRANLTRPVP